MGRLKLNIRFSIGLVIGLLIATNAYSQNTNKVVVVPLGEGKSTADMAIVGGGLASSSSIAENWGFPMTVISSSAGTARIRLEGYRPGCVGGIPHVFTSSFGTPHTSVAYAGASTSCVSGDMTINLNIINLDGTASDRFFAFYLVAPQGIPGKSVANSKSSFESCTFDAKTRVESCE